MKYKIERLGETIYPSPLHLSRVDGDYISNFVSDDDRIIVDIHVKDWLKSRSEQDIPTSFEVAGPRQALFFQPEDTRMAIVTCGGLCPGLNDVIRSLVMQAYYHYGVTEILGVRYGYNGMSLTHGGTAIPLHPQIVAEIHKKGGSFLGSSRGTPGTVEIVDFLQRRGVGILFLIGGDGTIRGAIEICDELKRRALPISVIGIPKTIDNDIAYIDRSFGYYSAVSKAREVLDSAHAEATGAYNGIGLVKLMGRHSGFITARGSLASGEANLVLIPEIPFEPDGEGGLLEWLFERLDRKHHALIAVAEGAGQDLLEDERKKLGTDASGNSRLADIGLYLKDRIMEYFSLHSIPVTIKYFDPSYLVRSMVATAEDSVFCSELAQYAIHAAFSGRTRMLVGSWNNSFVHIPMDLAISRRKTVDPDSNEWLSVIESTGQPSRFVKKV